MDCLEADWGWLEEKPLSGVSSTLGSCEEGRGKFHLLLPSRGGGRRRLRRDRRTSLSVSLFLEAELIPLAFPLTKEERWELSQLEFFKKSFQEACGELWVEITGGWVESPGKEVNHLVLD